VKTYLGDYSVRGCAASQPRRIRALGCQGVPAGDGPRVRRQCSAGALLNQNSP
jgi:hypothetical protein